MSVAFCCCAIRPYSIEWKGVADDARFDIDLHYCGSYSYCWDEVGAACRPHVLVLRCIFLRGWGAKLATTVVLHTCFSGCFCAVTGDLFSGGNRVAVVIQNMTEVLSRVYVRTPL